ncbi:hypothetical protein DFJ73DRAFT_549162 [Zopfochytrium polystomum]|nr:hypothetical protein DFJ73DRAFT_549162 [Zopfochytrium polystomum]
MAGVPTPPEGCLLPLVGTTDNDCSHNADAKAEAAADAAQAAHAAVTTTSDAAHESSVRTGSLLTSSSRTVFPTSSVPAIKDSIAPARTVSPSPFVDPYLPSPPITSSPVAVANQHWSPAINSNPSMAAGGKPLPPVPSVDPLLVSPVAPPRKQSLRSSLHRPLSSQSQQNATLLSVLAAARNTEVASEVGPEYRPSSRDRSRSLGNIRSHSTESDRAPSPPDGTVLPRSSFQSKRSQSLHVLSPATFHSNPISILLFLRSHPNDPLVPSIHSENLVLRAPKRMSHPLANPLDGVFLSAPIVLVTLKIRKRKMSQSSATGKIGSAISGVLKLGYSLGKALENSPTKNIGKPRSTPDLSIASGTSPIPVVASTSPPPARADEAGGSKSDDGASPVSLVFEEPAPRTSISSAESEMFWSGGSNHSTSVGTVTPAPPVPSGSSAYVSTSATFTSNRRIGTGFDLNEDQLSSQSANKKVVFKLITPSREVVLFAKTPAQFRSFKAFIERNRAAVLAGGSIGEDDNDLDSIEDDSKFSADPVKDGRKLLRDLKDCDASNRICGACGLQEPEWLAWERSLDVAILVCEDCSGIYRSQDNYAVRSFLYDVALFRDPTAVIYRTLQTTSNALATLQLKNASESGRIPPPPLLHEFAILRTGRRSRSLTSMSRTREMQLEGAIAITQPLTPTASSFGPVPTSSSGFSFGSVRRLKDHRLFHGTSASSTNPSGVGRFARGLGRWREGSNGSSNSLPVPSPTTHGPNSGNTGLSFAASRAASAPFGAPPFSPASGNQFVTQSPLSPAAGDVSYSTPQSAPNQHVSLSFMPLSPSAAAAAAVMRSDPSSPTAVGPESLQQDPSGFLSKHSSHYPTGIAAWFPNLASSSSSHSGTIYSGGPSSNPRRLPSSSSGSLGSVAGAKARAAAFSGQILSSASTGRKNSMDEARPSRVDPHALDIHDEVLNRPFQQIPHSAHHQLSDVTRNPPDSSLSAPKLSKQAALATVEAGTRTMRRFLAKMSESRSGSSSSSGGGPNSGSGGGSGPAGASRGGGGSGFGRISS